MRPSSKSQRGAALTGYALILSAFTVVSLGAIEGLNSASTSYLTETSDDIAESRELALYDELEEIPDPDGEGDETGEGDEGAPEYELADGGQFQSESDGLCMTLESDGKFRQRECDGSPEQQISVYTNSETGASQLKIGGDCIGVQNNSSNHGADYIVQDCDGDNDNQLFRRNETDLFWESATNRDPVMCLDVSNNGGEGQVIHQWGCKSTGNENQQWPDPAPYVPPIPDPPTPTITGEGNFEGPIPDGTDFSPDGAFEDDDIVFVFSESTIVLEADTTIDGTLVPAGTAVCSYIVWYDPVSTNDAATTIDFGAPIIGGARSETELANSNVFAAPGVTYDYSREWEANDEFVVSGSSLSITPYAVAANADMLRVFTNCT